MSKTKRVGKYELKETLGKGNFSKVKRSVNVETGEINAIKIVNISSVENNGLEKQVKREISVLKTIKHANIVQMIEVLKSPNHIYIVMELVLGGELFDKIVSAKKFDEKTARRYFQQLIDGIAYCHTNKIAHRDLKPENLLLDDKDNLKISDFGLSGIMQTNTIMLSTICGTPHYVAPEVLTGSYNGMIADIWSCGIILFVMISGCHPFDGDTVQELFKRIENLEFKYPPYVSKEVRALLDKIIVVDPLKRATLTEIMNDPWFKVDFKPLHRYESIGLEDLKPKTFQVPNVTDASSPTDMHTDPLVTPVTSGVPDIVVSNEDEENSVLNLTQDDIVKEEKTAPPPLIIQREESGVTRESRSSRLQNTEQLNAFELISLIQMDFLSPFLTGRKIVKKSANFVMTLHPDTAFSKISEYLDADYRLRQKEFNYEMKAANQDLEFQIKLFVVNLKLIVVQMTRVRGDTIKFLEVYETLEKKFAHNETK
ncbi:hypothetical protein AKO1_011549 [Acrasis kona]|uniref:non-specific serine/threonine protein kinase n=1 Tax=Acrasis kona TaxID=1008807 RepID=A0AAW2Z380_9EUKA